MAALIGSVVGGLITGVVTYWSLKENFNIQKEIDEIKEKSLVKAFLMSLHDEMEASWQTYLENMGKKIEELTDGEPLMMYYPIGEKYFIVYDNNSNLLGLVKDHKLRKSIIVIYTLAKGLVDSFRFHNAIVKDYELIYWENSQYANPVSKSRL